MRSLYILEIKPLSEVSLANIFSHMFGSFFHFNAVLFSSAEPFYMMTSHLFFLSFMTFVPGDIIVKILLHAISKIFLPVFSSRTFMMS